MKALNGSLVLTTTETREDADRIATLLVEEGFAACANIVPIRSVYRWTDKVERADEFLVMTKTLSSTFDSMMKALVKVHPYEVPEVVELQMKRVNRSYLAWMSESVKPGRRISQRMTGKRRMPTTPPKLEV